MDANTVLILTFLAVTLAAFALLRLAFGPERQMSKRLRGVSEYVATDEIPSEESVPSTRGRREASATLGARIDVLAREAWPRDQREKARQQLSRVGKVTQADVDRFLRQKLLYGFVAAVAAIVVSLVLGWSLAFGSMMAIGAALCGLFLPDSRLKDTIKKRQRQMLRELPDVLDMLTISVTAGLGFEAAIAKLVKNSSGLVVGEFDRMLKEVNAGASRRQAMRAMADRVDTPEMSVFVSSIIQAEMFGTPVAAVLRLQSGELRTKRRQRAEEEAQKAPVLMTIPLMVIILPATILIIIGPGLLSLVDVFG